MLFRSAAHTAYEEAIARNAQRTAPVITQRPTGARYLRDETEIGDMIRNAIYQASIGGTPMPDFNANPDAGRNHETPIDYVDYYGQRFAVYQWTASNRNGELVYTPRIARNFFEDVQTFCKTTKI